MYNYDKIIDDEERKMVYKKRVKNLLYYLFHAYRISTLLIIGEEITTFFLIKK